MNAPMQTGYSQLIKRINRLAPIQVGGLVYNADYLAALLTINLSDLPTHMADIANRIAEWGFLVAEAKRTHDRADSEKRRVYAQYAQRMVAGDQKLAEWKTKSFFRDTPEYVTAAKKVEDAEHIWNCCAAVQEALIQKAQTLRSLAAVPSAELASFISTAEPSLVPTAKPAKSKK